MDRLKARDAQDESQAVGKEKELKRLQTLKNDRIKLLKTPEFQRYINDLLARGGMMNSVMTGNSMTYWNSGRQDFTREVWADLAQADLDLAHDLLKPKFGEPND